MTEYAYSKGLEYNSCTSEPSVMKTTLVLSFTWELKRTLWAIYALLQPNSSATRLAIDIAAIFRGSTTATFLSLSVYPACIKNCGISA
jgi:hypothetical protein